MAAPSRPTALDRFEVDSFTADGTERTVYRCGTGPAVIVLAEIPGITPRVAAFAERVAGIGCTAVVPHLFGVPGQDPDDRGRLLSTARILRSLVPACISREFVVLATGRSSPVVSWLRALAAHEHDRAGGPGVGVVGMCFTGGFALAMAADPRILAPVMSQPSLPVAIGRRRAGAVDCSPGELDRVAGRCAAGELEVVGLRFKGDRLVPAARFDFLRERLGDAFVAVELDDADANPASRRPPHSVLTEDLVDRPGEPTHDALVLVLDHVRRRLLPDAAS